MTRFSPWICAAAAIVLALGIAACGGDDNSGDDEGVQALSDDFCGELQYAGEGDPKALIVSDLPMQGDSAVRSEQMVEAIRLVLERENWQSGGTNVAFQPCDDSLEDTGEWDKERCRENAEAYAENSDVIGVIGTYNSGCAQEMIPILNEAPDGGVAMVSPGNTLVCLTIASEICDEDEPDVYFPEKQRNYARVVPNDAVQGAGLATFAEQQGIENPYILFADDPVSQGQGETFANAAEALGMTIAGIESWDPKAKDYVDLMEEVSATGADAVLIAGLLDDNGAQLIQDKVDVLGPNEETKLLAPDGFAQQATIDDAGEASANMFASVPGRLPSTLDGPGSDLVAELEESVEDSEPVELFAPYAGEAAEVLLQAMEPGAARASIIDELLRTDIKGGIIGDFTIEESGDPSAPPISVSIARGQFEPAAVITPVPDLILAALGEDIVIEDVEVDTDGTSTTP